MRHLSRLIAPSLAAFMGLGSSGVLGAETAARQTDLTLLQTISDGDGDARFDLAAVDSKAHRLYIARGYGVMAVDLVRGQVTHQLVAGKHVHAVVPLPDGQVLSTNGDLDTATLFDGVSGKVRAEISTGQNPDAAVFDPASKLVFVMNGKDGTRHRDRPGAWRLTGQIHGWRQVGSGRGGRARSDLRQCREQQRDGRHRHGAAKGIGPLSIDRLRRPHRPGARSRKGACWSRLAATDWPSAFAPATASSCPACQSIATRTRSFSNPSRKSS